jgi:DNA mismatch repair protein MutL
MKIHVLAPQVVNKIAAGEVIERPASVVKELVENSVDAGSTRIDVEVEQGGSELIRVVDNGCGIHADELPLAFASHATSKLTSADDLFNIRTLGFRGEALASIGSVAQVRLQSRPHDLAQGAEIACQAGELSAVRDWNGAPGTRIEVCHLFYNTPVRRKFLRTIATEMGHVCEAFTRLALAQPSLYLTLRHNDKRVYEVSASTGLAERMTLFFGSELSEQLYEVEARAGPATLRGVIADPSCERGTPKMQYIFVNGRWVRDRSLGHALQEGYRGLLMTGRFAVAVLFLDLPCDLVDVNVHPTKAEVRFRDGQAIYHLVFGAVRDRLRLANLTPKLKPTLTPVPAEAEAPPAGGLPRGFHFPSAVAQGTLAPWELPAKAAITQSVAAFSPAHTAKPQEPATKPANNDEPDRAMPAPPRAVPLPAKAIQLYNAYLVLEAPEGMLVIDQHALHERILFEQFKRRLQAGQLEVQRLLIPEPVDLPADQAARVLDHRQELLELGLGIEDFGGGTILLTSYPAILGNRSPVAIFHAVADHLTAKDRLPSREHLLNDLLSLMACHAAVRSGDRLTPEEISALLAQRDLAENTHHCPHGRPTSLLFSRQELDRQFRRT